MYVYHLSAQEKEKKKNARIFKKKENSRRASNSQKTPTKEEKEAGSLMIERKHRLKLGHIKIKDFNRVFRGELLEIKKRPNGLNHARFGVLVSRRAFSKATERNLLRRRVFGFLNQHRDVWRGRPGFDWLVVFLTSAKGIFNNRKVLYRELNYVLHF